MGRNAEPQFTKGFKALLLKKRLRVLNVVEGKL